MGSPKTCPLLTPLDGYASNGWGSKPFYRTDSRTRVIERGTLLSASNVNATDSSLFSSPPSVFVDKKSGDHIQLPSFSDLQYSLSLPAMAPPSFMASLPSARSSSFDPILNSAGGLSQHPTKLPLAVYPPYDFQQALEKLFSYWSTNLTSKR